MPMYWETFNDVRAVQRAGKQKFKKRHVISCTSHMEKRVDFTCFYV